MTCCCETIGASPEVRLCAECHRYWFGDKELTSVTRVIKDVLPPSYDGVPDGVLENARDRGVELDGLISKYVVGKLDEIPAGTRQDVVELFEKFQDWWDKQNFKCVQSQRVVHCEDIAGTLDLCADRTIFDVKCTYDLLPSHSIQIAGYLDMDSYSTDAALIHITKRYKAPKIVPLEGISVDDWEVVRDFWRLKRRIA